VIEYGVCDRVWSVERVGGIERVRRLFLRVHFDCEVIEYGVLKGLLD
jgi:hypothetical protein